MPNWIFPCRGFSRRLAARLWKSAPMRTVYQRKRLRRTENSGTVPPITNLMADSELRSPDSYLGFLVTIHLSRLVSQIFACDGRTDNADHHYSSPLHCGGPAKNQHHFWYEQQSIETSLLHYEPYLRGRKIWTSAHNIICIPSIFFHCKRL